MRAFLKIFSVILVICGISLTISFLVNLSNDFTVSCKNSILLPETGQVGDFIGGVVGTVFSLAGFFILVLTLTEQSKFANKERFESKFFDLLKLHRENVKELEKDNISGRKEFQLIFRQFLDCREDMKPVFHKLSENNIYEPAYLKDLKEKLSLTNNKIDFVNLAKLHLPYLVTFYGVESEGKNAIRDILEDKYKSEFLKDALDFISMKPIESSEYFENWKTLNKQLFKQRLYISRLIKKIRNSEQIEDSDLAKKAKNIYYKSDYVKYYGGHQYQLGHYFRHLYQTFNFINIQKDLKHEEKYFFAKTLRAQLSTPEQYLLFINSLSILGLVWDLIPEMPKKRWNQSDKKLLDDSRLITKYNLIKNIPGKEIFGIAYKDYYPDVEYEHMR